MKPAIKNQSFKVELPTHQLVFIGELVANLLNKQNQTEEFDFMTTQEVCKVFRLRPETFSRIRKKNGIKPARIGKPNLYNKKDIQKLLNKKNEIKSIV